MKIVRIVPMFKRNREIEAYIPQLIGFSGPEELEMLRRIGRAIPKKMWAFVEHSIPAEYSGQLITLDSPPERLQALKEARKDIIGYNLKVVMGVKEQLEKCHAVAIDTLYGQFTQVLALQGLYCNRARTVALSVNSLEEFDRWRAEGFDLFIGDFYAKTVITGGQAVDRLNPVKANQMALLAEIASWKDKDENQDLRRMSSIIERDVALTMGIIRMANSAAFGGRTQLNHVHDAIVRVGTANLKRWSISYLSSAVTDEKTPEISRVALLRAKFLENLCGQLGLDSWSGFFTGLTSVAGVMLGIPQQDALAEMNAPPAVAEALQYKGRLGFAYGIVENYINGNQEKMEQFLSGTSVGETLYLAYVRAELEVCDMLTQMETTVSSALAASAV